MKPQEKALDDAVWSDPVVVIYTRAQVTMVHAALTDAEERFSAQPADEFPLPWIRSAMARTEAVMNGLPDV